MKEARELIASSLVAALPLALALAFSTRLEPTFSSAKTGLMFAMAGVLACITVSRGDALWMARVVSLRRSLFAFAAAVVLFVCVMLTSAVRSPWSYMAAPKILFVVTGVVLWWACVPVIREREHAVVDGACASAFVVALIAIAQYVFDFDLLGWFGNGAAVGGRMRMYATLGNPNFVAAWLAASLPAALHIANTSTSRAKRTLGWVGVATVVAAIALTGSRAGVLAAGVACGVYCSLVVRNKAWLRVTIVAVALASAIFVPASLNERLPMTALRGRSTLWRVALSDGEAWKSLGAGPNTFAYRYPMMAGTAARTGAIPNGQLPTSERHAHNDFVEYWSECGWMGAIALLVMFGSWFAFARATAGGEVSPTISAAMAAVSAILVTAMFDFPLNRAEMWAMLWLWMAVPAARVLPKRDREAGFAGRRWAMATVVLAAGLGFAYQTVAASWWRAEGIRNEDLGLFASAVRDYDRAIALEPTSQTAQFNRARALARDGRYAEAIRASQAAFRYVNEPELWLLMVRVEQRMGLQDFAFKHSRFAADAFPYSDQLRAEQQRLAAGSTQ